MNGHEGAASLQREPRAACGVRKMHSAMPSLQEEVVTKFSVLIPAYLRPDDLRKTLQRTLRQTCHDIEIVVIDDSTPNSSIEDAVREFETVRYFRTPENLGLIGARNFGAKRCEGELILNLDDDSWLVDDDGLMQIATYMDERPDVGVAALNIGLVDQGYFWPEDSPSLPVRYYTGCGNVYRKTVVDMVGDYVEEFYRQGEELDRTLRVMDLGYRVMSLPSVRVFHSQSPINRNPGKHLAFEAANYLRRELIRAPLPLLALGVARALRFTMRHRREMDFRLFQEEIFGNRVPLLNFIRRKRRSVRVATYLRWMMLRKNSARKIASPSAA